VSVVVDHVDHLELLDVAAREAGTVVPVVVEVDMAYRAFGLHLGVRRSPLHEIADVVTFAKTIDRYGGLRFHGIMGYEAQIAGLGDTGPHLRALKQVSRPHVERVRRELAEALRPRLFNGGGTGSLSWCAREDALTEVTAGSAFLGSHLFDRYRDIAPEPAAFFALEVARQPAPGIVTCHGGGYVASGEAGKDRLPLPWLPEGLSLLPMEGAGEVQTPLKTTTDMRVGDPVIFRHAKGGELAEHFAEYLLLRGDRVERRAATYRTWTKRG
jgi:D-serine deaminase-like pyridoxal phosphate-dependent protein